MCSCRIKPRLKEILFMRLKNVLKRRKDRSYSLVQTPVSYKNLRPELGTGNSLQVCHRGAATPTITVPPGSWSHSALVNFKGMLTSQAEPLSPWWDYLYVSDLYTHLILIRKMSSPNNPLSHHIISLWETQTVTSVMYKPLCQATCCSLVWPVLDRGHTHRCCYYSPLS